MAMTGLTATGLQLVPADVSLSGVKANLIGTGVSLAGGVSLAAASSPFVPLPGSAIDLYIATGQSFGGTVANCFNGGQTQAIGALQALMIAAQGSMVLELAANPTGASYFTNDAGSVYFAKIGTNQFRAVTENSTILTATFGSGDYTAISKLAVSWSPSGTVVVANNGTIITNVDPLFTFGDASAVNVVAFPFFRRVTGWTTQIANATLKGFTV